MVSVTTSRRVAVYGWRELKKELGVTETTVECPVLECGHKVERQRNRFVVDDKFICPEHDICISPTTWKYASKADNLLWNSPAEMTLLSEIENTKRESRIAFDNSEDAVTFNVFRFLELQPQLLEEVLREMGGESVHNPRLVYWSHDQEANEIWAPLEQARKEFGEQPRSGSEPDLIVATAETLFFIEAKVTSANRVSAPKSGNSKRYLTGGDSLFERVFTVDWATASADRYELTRFWLLGSWLAADLGLKFRLVSLLPMRLIQQFPPEHFGTYIAQSTDCGFGVFAWEYIWKALHRGDATAQPTSALLDRYFLNKTVGYDHRHRLQLAFRVYW
jgi:hypothetical protein